MIWDEVTAADILTFALLSIYNLNTNSNLICKISSIWYVFCTQLSWNRI